MATVALSDVKKVKLSIPWSEVQQYLLQKPGLLCAPLHYSDQQWVAVLRTSLLQRALQPRKLGVRHLPMAWHRGLKCALWLQRDNVCQSCQEYSVC